MCLIKVTLLPQKVSVFCVDICLKLFKPNLCSENLFSCSCKCPRRLHLEKWFFFNFTLQCGYIFKVWWTIS